MSGAQSTQARVFKRISNALAVLLLVSTHVCFSSLNQTLELVSSEGPPHTINHPEHSGIDLDITKVVLAQLGYTVRLEFVALGRAEKLVRTGQYDLMAPIFSTQDSKNFYISDPIVTYKPMVFSLANRNLTPRSIDELANHSVITFQGAPGYFGEAFRKMSEQAVYRESPDMSVIPQMLVKSRYDYAVLDQYIFYYFYRLKDKRRPLTLFRHHYLIPPVPASVAFKEKSLRDRFNRALAQFKRGDGYQQIIEAYIGKVEKMMFAVNGTNVSWQNQETGKITDFSSVAAPHWQR
ncbi:ABC transporter substrate-binding protein [Pseudoalteromonas sp. OOF1S-7]|uniref:substrate-binding periplasmic protein n=1 Tax=Pseudoalteromonas sp. OOF1S-7 TaxID=2917757 RepID=UPI001EF6CC64|nr:ABC transporter substrate-binding protein [Pseudoalteromonas sp. OOF1S-7]MCG7534214.1 ABC transporter substrate-binding protein [Pseudoalteromonas sp. OOF1S-7]